MINNGIVLHPEHGVNPSMGVCPICRHESGEILLLGNKSKRYTGEDKAPMYVMSQNPCKDCEDKLDKGYIAIIEGNEKGERGTEGGKIAWLKEKAFKGVFDREPPECKACYMEKSVIEQLEKMMHEAEARPDDDDKPKEEKEKG